MRLLKDNLFSFKRDQSWSDQVGWPAAGVVE
jgi:hypothetical protein